MEVENLGFRKGWQSFDAKENGSLICCYDTNNVPKLSSQSSKDPFPVDIIYKILSRLPIKSLARFRCVCKLWLDYINDPYLHIIHVKEPTPILFQYFPRGAPEKIAISFLHGVQKEPVLELCYKGMFFGYLLLGSCNGLLLVCYEQEYPMDAATYGFAVINPFSKERGDLPPIPIKMLGVELGGPYLATGIAFDHSTNTLKTVFFIIIDAHTNVACTMVHSSWSSLWRETAQNPPYPIKGEGVYGHGRLHWMVDWVLSDERKIVWFDVNTEEFGSRDPPNPKEGGHWDWDWDNQLVDLNGELGFSYFGPFGIKLWILKQQDEWVLRCCFDLSPILLPPYNTDTCDIHIKISGCWNNDGDILLNYDLGERLFVYSLKSGVLREVDLEDSCKGSDIRVYRSGLFSLHTSA